eukprot:3175040-Amphidinium_carterae.1
MTVLIGNSFIFRAIKQFCPPSLGSHGGMVTQEPLHLHVAMLSGTTVCTAVMKTEDTVLDLCQVVRENLELRARIAPLASLLLLFGADVLKHSAKLKGLPADATLQLVRKPREECGEHIRVS